MTGITIRSAPKGSVFGVRALRAVFISVGGVGVSFVITTPQVLVTASMELAAIGPTLSEANAEAAAVITGLVPAAQDEVSERIAALFGSYAQGYHALSARVASSHQELVEVLNASAGSYAAAESVNAAALQIARHDVVNAVNATTESLLGRSRMPAGERDGVVDELADLTTTETTEVMGGTGMPVPSTRFINAVDHLFLQPNLPGTNPVGLDTPEQFYPLRGVKQLTMVASVSEGAQILNNALQPYISSGTPVGVFGYSQSAVIASLEMEALQAAGVPSSEVHFVLMGGPMNPNGGLFERFAGLNLTALGIDFFGATPSNAYPTTIYTMEYDGWGDFPEFPLDILSDMNDFMSTTHFQYTSLTATQVQNAIQLSTSGATQTTYYVIPTSNLPLVDPLRNIPLIGNPIADLLQPDLTYLVNLGYGDPLYGWSTSPANVPTQFGLVPPLSAFKELPGLLVSGAHEGIQNFIGDFMGTGPNPVTLPSLTSLLEPPVGAAGVTSALTNSLTALSPASFSIANLQNAITNVADTISSSASNAYSTLLPTADIINAALISIPAYDVNLFLDGISQAINGQPVQGLVNAFARPLVADLVLYPFLGEFF
jgi:PE-PPE domain/PE family